MAEPNRVVSAAPIQQNEEVDRSASGLQYQRYQMGLKATGATLGMGRRSVNDPSSQFRSPPMSSAQFGGGGGARASMGDEGDL